MDEQDMCDRKEHRMSKNDRDWIGIVPVGCPDTDGEDYKYMPRGLGKGSLTFDPRSPGKYNVF
jgi:hypothetical protein